jgi:hypothetical protein
MKKPTFYMSAYLTYAICSSVQFPAFGWDLNQDQPLIHVYFSELWDANYKRYIYDICDFFLAPLHIIIFCYSAYKLSKEAMVGIKGIEDWYLGKYYTYIRVYVNSKAPHLLPKYIPDILLIREISYYTMITRITSFLSASYKNLWPTFPIHIGSYTLLNVPHTRK